MSEENKREQEGDQEILKQNPENTTEPNKEQPQEDLQPQEVEGTVQPEDQELPKEIEASSTDEAVAEPKAESEEVITEPEDKESTEAVAEAEVDQKENTPIINSDEPKSESPVEEVVQPEAPEEPAISSEEEPVAEVVDKSSEESVKETDDSQNEEPEVEKAEEEEEIIDYSTFSREQLVDAAEELSKQEHVARVENTIGQIVPLFSEMEKGLKETALNKFIVDGGNPDDFEFNRDDLFNRFNAAVRLIRDKRARFIKDREANKERNFEKKQALLDRLRDLVDGENATTNISPIKEIQQEWRTIGPVPNQHNKTLWANYNALLDRFYNNRHILFELKELDRKKNQKLKEALCEKAEALNGLDDIKTAIIQLNELHEEYKKIGAVPREVQESLWQRFKAASDEIYKKRKAYLEDLKGELQENLVKKKELAEEIKAFVSFDSDRINEWNAKTKEVIAIQKKWEALGGLPREHAKEVNREFWGAFKTFFSHKNAFFKKLEGQRKENLEAKQRLVEEARALKESDDWNKTADKLKGLQRKWKEIGPVPEKFRNSVYADFKEACDEFFNNRRASLNRAEEGYTENLTKKEELCAQIEGAAKQKKGSAEDLDTWVNQWKEIGFVPKNSIKKIEERFEKALESFVGTLDVPEEDREGLIMKAQLSGLSKGPNADRNIQKKEGAIRRQIQELEDNINLWNNNLAFFANSKTADKLKVEFDEKIEKAEEEVRKLKKQLRLVRSI